MKLDYKYYYIDMSDNSVWRVPIEVIARNRAEHFKHEFNGNVEKSLQEDTIPLFNSDRGEIEDWASNNMNWDDVRDQAVVVETDEMKMNKKMFQAGWVNGYKEISSEELYGDKESI